MKPAIGRELLELPEKSSASTSATALVKERPRSGMQGGWENIICGAVFEKQSMALMETMQKLDDMMRYFLLH